MLSRNFESRQYRNPSQNASGKNGAYGHPMLLTYQEETKQPRRPIIGLPARGLHGLKTEARTRPVPEIVWPDPTRAAQLNLEPEPDPPPPTTNSQLNKKRKKAAFHDCMQRNRLIKALPFHKHLPVMKVCEHQVQWSHTFCWVYEFCMDKKIILPPCILW